MAEQFDQLISREALKLVRAVPLNLQTEYKANAENLPYLLRNAGLARAHAFLTRKSGAPQKLAEHLTHQFRQAQLLSPTQLIMEASAAADLSTHRLHFEFALRVALWHKRIAQALFAKQANSNSDPNQAAPGTIASNA